MAQCLAPLALQLHVTRLGSSLSDADLVPEPYPGGGWRADASRRSGVDTLGYGGWKSRLVPEVRLTHRCHSFDCHWHGDLSGPSAGRSMATLAPCCLGNNLRPSAAAGPSASLFHKDCPRPTLRQKLCVVAPGAAWHQSAIVRSAVGRRGERALTRAIDHGCTRSITGVLLRAYLPRAYAR